ncbi:MAG: hypothetical protein QOH83_2991 [Solirubrobacteraceae bacterium]|nr:hypothetical protein [Solirubrobacteraceae bacterium]
MSVSVADEVPRADDDPAFRDAVTFSFGDPAASVYGLARVGLGGGGASGFAVVYAGDTLAGASTEAEVEFEVAAGAVASWAAVSAAGVRSTVETPLAAWTVTYDGPEAGFDLRFEAVSAPAVLDAEEPVARACGMEGYEQLCSVTGTVRVGERRVGVRCLGQRGHLWGLPDWSRIELARTLSAWMGADRGVTLTAVRPAKAKHHDEEAVAGFLIDGGEPLAIFDPRLSTTYDGSLRPRRAGLELWMQEDGGLARRAAGEVLCGTTVDLGDLRLDSAFFRWRMEGREGTGRYDVLRRVRGDGDGGGGARRRR